MTRDAFALLALVAACDGVQSPDVDLERMIDQSKYTAYAPSEFFANGMAMRVPPEGSLRHGAAERGSPQETGQKGDGYITAAPVTATPEMLRRGRERFGIFCAPCHGILGNGDTMVAANMPLRRPPSLLDENVRRYPDGRIYRVITEGYGLMRSYTDSIGESDRWAVVLYVRALQIGAAVRIDALPPSLQERARSELP